MNYEHDRTLDWYLLFHYGSRLEVLSDSPLETVGRTWDEAFFRFPIETVRAGIEIRGRALDLGCAVGRSSFELSTFAEETIGIDFSQAFVDAAESLRRGRSIAYRRYSEAHLFTSFTASAPPDARRDRVRFETGDAMSLRGDLGGFDFVHAANLLCRLAEPRRLLDRLPDLVNPGGSLVLATPATWLPEFTAVENQPKGQTLDFLRHALERHFVLVRAVELPFLIREHGRKFQISTSQTSVWARRAQIGGAK